jgi:8-oxo-dGTP pyrophosphatase MutT (NUDIX family)
MNISDTITNLLSRYPDSDYSAVIEQLGRDGNEILNRNNFSGHITTSGLILHPDKLHVFMIHHLKYDMWLNPGGHFEDDESLEDSVKRECFEETGIPVRVGKLLNIDTHFIPKNNKEPRHIHHDFLYLCYADTDTFELEMTEVIDGRWFKIDELLTLPGERWTLVVSRLGDLIGKIGSSDQKN